MDTNFIQSKRRVFIRDFFNFLIIRHNSIFNSLFSTYVRKVSHSKKRKARYLCGGILTLLMVIYFSFSLGNSSQKLLTKRIVYRNNCLFKEAWIMSILTNELYFINVGRIAPEFFSCGIDCFLEIWLRHISRIFTPTGRIYILGLLKQAERQYFMLRERS